MELPIHLPRFVTAIDQDEVTSSLVEKMPEHSTENFTLRDGRVVRVHRSKDRYYETVWATLNDFTWRLPPIAEECHIF